ncbi:MAG: hypothetical protein KBF58_08960 [Methyloversatilis sp.]|nr:hypothetical protein [Methyloversatilis sp.]MBP6194004.1 hypothetical protein [Methyloversatilis sp.]MBP9118195.1 hypothetical protein [Methyloversatilis sp.]
MASSAVIAHLFSVAVTLSGYPGMPEADLPLVRLMEPSALIEEACADDTPGCDKLVAVYDRERHQILMRSDLDLHDASDNSFLVHEFVHVLEARHKGALYQRDCEATLRSEREAYRVQNAYLDREGRSERYGAMLEHRVCAVDQPGSSAMRLDMAPSGSRDQQALETFMRELGRRDSSAARRR